MSATARRKAADACFKVPTSSTVTSTDGGLAVPVTPGNGKKPCQRKRKQAEKSTSLPKKKPASVVCMDDDFVSEL